MALKNSNGNTNKLPSDYRAPGTTYQSNYSSSTSNYGDTSWVNAPDKEKRSFWDRAGAFCDVIVDIIRNPSALKVLCGVGIIITAVLNIHSLVEVIQKVLLSRQQIDDISNFFFRIPLIGWIFGYLNYLFSGFVVAFIGFVFWIILQGCELLIRVDLFVEDAATNIVNYANDRSHKRVQPNSSSPHLQRLSKISQYNPSLLFIGACLGIGVYCFEFWATGQVRPWTDRFGNFTANTATNFWSVFGVQICLVLYHIFKMISYQRKAS